MITRVDSVQNPLVKSITALHLAKERARTGFFLIEGPHLVDEALKYQGGSLFQSFFLTAGYRQTDLGRRQMGQLNALGLPGYELSEAAFAKIAETDCPQGVLAVGRIPRNSLGNVPEGAMTVLLDQIQDPGNMGTIIRTAAAAGAGAVLIMKGSTDPYGGKAVRASQGGLFALPVVTGLEPVELTGWLKTSGRRLICTSPHDGVLCFETDLRGGCVLALGHEAHGVSPEICQQADDLTRIPLIGQVESLNVAIAAAVLLFEACRQRMYS